jgi:hypothetical protein
MRVLTLGFVEKLLFFKFDKNREFSFKQNFDFLNEMRFSSFRDHTKYLVTI